MTGIIFFKKEIKNILKTYRVWVLPLIFVFFGILSPVTAKFTPYLLKTLSKSNQAFQIKIPQPIARDSYAQWLKNMSQLGVLIIIILTMGIVSEEKIRGTLAIVITKPVSRASIIISKYFAQSSLVIISILLGMGACFLYTILLFNKAPIKPLLLSTISFAVLYLLILAFTVLFSTIFRQQIITGGLALLAYFTISILSIFGHGLEKYSPSALSEIAAKYANAENITNALYPIITSILFSLLIITVAILIFQRQEI